MQGTGIQINKIKKNPFKLLTMTAKKRTVIKWIVLAGISVISTAAIIGYKMYNKPHRNVEKTEGVIIDATALATRYETNEPEANREWLDKVLQVTGEITEVTANQQNEKVLSLKGSDMSSVRCTIESNSKAEFKIGQRLTIKGICTGYLSDVILVRCVILST